MLLKILLFPLIVQAQRAVATVVGNTLKLVHVSDVHYNVPLPQTKEERLLVDERYFHNVCIDVEEDDYQCGPGNTTQFLRSVYSLEDPDLVVFTGDVLDQETIFPHWAMRLVYSSANPHLWAAVAEESKVMTQQQAAEFILQSDGTLNTAAQDRFSFYVDVTNPDNTTTLVRLVFFDKMITETQLKWFTGLPSTTAPVLAFFHVPIKEYQHAVDAGVLLVGEQREPIWTSENCPNVLPTLKRHGVVATFCGHDHVNDFCVPWQGVTLCYSGSPGFTAYGKCDSDGTCLARRSRVVEMVFGDKGDLGSVRTWLRVDAGGSIASTERLHDHVIYSS